MLYEKPANLGIINKSRFEMGLKPIIRKSTACLCCRQKFESSDYPRIRICDYCKEKNAEFYYREATTVRFSSSSD